MIESFDLGGGLVLRRNRLDDADALALAVGESLDHLIPWMPWAEPEAALATVQYRRLADMQAKWNAGSDFGFVIADGLAIVGAVGLHRRGTARSADIGYWLHVGHTHRGLATQAAGLLTWAAWSLPDIDQVEIHCDPANTASAAVAARLGYRLDRVVPRTPAAPGETGTQQVWVRDRPLSPGACADRVAADGAALIAAARIAPDAPVPSCPEWDMAGLVAHTGSVHRWVTGILASRATERPKRSTDAPPDFAALGQWFEEGVVGLCDQLASTDPDALVWNWLDQRPVPARWWHRRMVHETAVHRWDAASAAGRSAPIAADVAADGIDEFLGFVGRRGPIEGLSGSLALAPTDSQQRWSFDVTGSGLRLRGRPGDTDALVQGSASDVLLWVLNRGTPAVSVSGDESVAAAWKAVSF